jgi:CRISPR-associated protein Csd1
MLLNQVILFNVPRNKRDKDFVKFKKSIIERFLPCIIDGRQIPIDIVETAIRKASNPLAFKDNEKWQWERTLSIACALYRCYSIRNSNNKNKYTMALEPERIDRDYLYGRLLAVAEHLEETALYMANEKRETSAARLMQRFADYPYQTWRSLESALVPYKSRLNSNRPGFLFKIKNLFDEIIAKFQPGDFEKDGRLSGAYLLGYHCQRLVLKVKKYDEENEIKNNE